MRKYELAFMPTPRETILTALADLLSTVPRILVLRGEVLLECIPIAGANQFRTTRLNQRQKCQRQSKSEPNGSAKCCHFGVGAIAA